MARKTFGERCVEAGKYAAAVSEINTDLVQLFVNLYDRYRVGVSRAVLKSLERMLQWGLLEMDRRFDKSRRLPVRPCSGVMRIELELQGVVCIPPYMETSALQGDNIVTVTKNEETEECVTEDMLKNFHENMLPTSKKTPKEVVTLPLPVIPRKPGRPRTGKALSPAERQKRFRESKRKEDEAKAQAAHESFASESDAELLQWLVKAGPTLQEKAWIELGRRKGWKMPDISL